MVREGLRAATRRGRALGVCMLRVTELSPPPSRPGWSLEGTRAFRDGRPEWTLIQSSEGPHGQAGSPSPSLPPTPAEGAPSALALNPLSCLEHQGLLFPQA